MLKLPLGGFWVVLQRCRLNGRHVESGHNAVHVEGSGCCKEHGVRSLPVRFKVLGLMCPDIHRIANLDRVQDF